MPKPTVVSRSHAGGSKKRRPVIQAKDLNVKRNLISAAMPLFRTALAVAFVSIAGCSHANDEAAVVVDSASIQPMQADSTAESPAATTSPAVTKPAAFQFTAAAGNAAQDDWPQFRGSSGGVAAASRLPATWSAKENIVWKTELPGAGTSSPIIIGGRIFLTCYRGFGAPGQTDGALEDLRLDLLSLDRATGKILWTKTVTPSLPEQPTIRDQHGYSSSTPAADGQHVYVFFGKTGVFAYDYDGKQVWRADVGSKLSGWGSAASPILFDDMLIVNASVESESLVALDKKTGEEKWRAKGIREAWNTPLLAANGEGAAELIVPIIQKILAFDPATGERLWSCDTGIGWYMVPSAVAQNGIVYCIGGRSGDALAVRTGGRGDVSQTHRLWRRNKGSNVSSPILHEGRLYWMHEQRGIAYCADAATGEIMYEERVPRAGQIYASPVLADGKIYYVNRGGRVFVVAAKPEFQLLATNELEQRGRFDASPAVAGDKLYLRSNRYLYCIGEKP